MKRISKVPKNEVIFRPFGVHQYLMEPTGKLDVIFDNLCDIFERCQRMTDGQYEWEIDLRIRYKNGHIATYSWDVDEKESIEGNLSICRNNVMAVLKEVMENCRKDVKHIIVEMRILQFNVFACLSAFERFNKKINSLNTQEANSLVATGGYVDPKGLPLILGVD
jgi:hypothetical protein